MRGKDRHSHRLVLVMLRNEASLNCTKNHVADLAASFVLNVTSIRFTSGFRFTH